MNEYERRETIELLKRVVGKATFHSDQVQGRIDEWLGGLSPKDLLAAYMESVEVDDELQEPYERFVAACVTSRIIDELKSRFNKLNAQLENESGGPDA